MSNIERNVLRTVVPSVIGAVVAWVIKEWAKLPGQDLAYLTPLATSAYYTAVRFAEEEYPKLGWLLGCLPAPKTPAEPKA